MCLYFKCSSRYLTACDVVMTRCQGFRLYKHLLTAKPPDTGGKHPHLRARKRRRKEQEPQKKLPQTDKKEKLRLGRMGLSVCFATCEVPWQASPFPSPYPPELAFVTHVEAAPVRATASIGAVEVEP